MPSFIWYAVREARRDVMSGNAPPGWYPAGDGSSELRWWDGSRWTDFLAAPRPVLDQDAFEARRTWGEAWYSLTDPAGKSIGDAYEVQTGAQQTVTVPMESARPAGPLQPFTSLEAVIRDTRQAHLLSAVRLSSDRSVSICGPDRTPLGTISHAGDASQMEVQATVGSMPAYRIVPGDRVKGTAGSPRFSIQRSDGVEVGSLTLRRIAPTRRTARGVTPSRPRTDRRDSLPAPGRRTAVIVWSPSG
jgi:hypothetical protein